MINIKQLNKLTRSSMETQVQARCISIIDFITNIILKKLRNKD